jgi:hypothetical protein
LAHDLTAVVSQLALGDLGCHTMSVARVLHSVPYQCRADLQRRAIPHDRPVLGSATKMRKTPPPF